MTTDIKNDRPDWQVITLAIRRHYKPLAKVAIEINSEEKHLNRLARGEVKDTKYKTGCRLLKIYRGICAKLNKQPEWIADLEVHPLPEPVRVQPLHTSPRLIGFTTPRTISDVARKYLGETGACQ